MLHVQYVQYIQHIQFVQYVQHVQYVQYIQHIQFVQNVQHVLHFCRSQNVGGVFTLATCTKTTHTINRSLCSICEGLVRLT